MFRSLRMLLAATLLLTLAACASIRPPAPYVAPAGVAHAEEFQPGASSDMPLFGQDWMPADGKPRAVILLVHGTTQHSGLYAPIAEELARAGYGVYGLDLRGWGRSPGEGKRGFVRSHDEYVRDVVMTLNLLRERYPSIPVYGAGESLGGTVLLRGEIKGETDFAGLILSDPGYKVNPSLLGIRAPGFLARFALWGGGVAGSILPGWPTVPSNPGLRAVICDDDLRARMLSDPYVSHNWLPAAYLTAFRESQVLIAEGLERITAPVLIVHGDQDNLVPLASSREIINRIRSSEKSLSVIDNGCHISFVEPASWRRSAHIIKTWLARQEKARAQASR